MICLYTIQQHRNDGHRISLGQEDNAFDNSLSKRLDYEKPLFPC